MRTQAEVVDSISNSINLKIFPVIIASKIDSFCDETTACKRLINFLSIDFQTWQLIHWHTLMMSSRQGREERKRGNKNKMEKERNFHRFYKYVKKKFDAESIK